MMDVEQIRAYLLEELYLERYKWCTNEPNHYSFLYMICNDIGIVPED